MMKQTIISFVMASAICPAALQAVEPWSLDSCINYAISHNITVKSRELQKQSGELEIIEAKDRFLPQVSAGANQSFSFGRGLTSENTYANRNTSNFGWNVGLSLPVFQGLSAVRRLNYAKANLRVLVEECEAAKDDITLNVISQYLQVLYCIEMREVAKNQLEVSKLELKNREAKFDVGSIPEADLLEAKALVARDELSFVSANNDYSIALVDLAQMLELTDVEGFEIQPIDSTSLGLLSADEVYRNALNHNHSILASRNGLTVADKNIELAKTGYIPTLSFNAGIGSSYYTLSGAKTESFGRQMKNNLSKSLGFSLNIPIFNAFSTRNSIRRAKVQRVNAQLQLDDAEKRLYKTIQQAYVQATAAEKKMSSSKLAEQASLAAFNVVREKYNYGRANATEFEQAKNTYVRAVSESVQAKYEAILRTRILQFYNTPHNNN